jgi:hypothetical protein
MKAKKIIGVAALALGCAVAVVGVGAWQLSKAIRGL